MRTEGRTLQCCPAPQLVAGRGEGRKGKEGGPFPPPVRPTSSLPRFGMRRKLQMISLDHHCRKGKRRPGLAFLALISELPRRWSLDAASPSSLRKDRRQRLRPGRHPITNGYLSRSPLLAADRPGQRLRQARGIEGPRPLARYACGRNQRSHVSPAANNGGLLARVRDGQGGSVRYSYMRLGGDAPQLDQAQT